MARTHDLDRKHMMEIFRQAHDHKGASFVEIFQNCNVFNDGAFDDVTRRQVRDEMMIDLHHGQPISFGADGHKGVVMGTDGQLRIVEVADVGEEAILVHDAHRDDPGLAFALARLSLEEHSPRPSACSARSSVPTTAWPSVANSPRHRRRGPRRLATLLRSNGTWAVN